MALLMKTRIIIGFPDDSTVICPLLHIASVATHLAA